MVLAFQSLSDSLFKHFVGLGASEADFHVEDKEGNAVGTQARCYLLIFDDLACIGV